MTDLIGGTFTIHTHTHTQVQKHTQLTFFSFLKYVDNFLIFYAVMY